MPLEFSGPAARLAPGRIATAAEAIKVEPAAARAVVSVESRGVGFLRDTRPVILYEAHSFSVLTHGIYDQSHPNISSPVWNRSLYSASAEGEYVRLSQALELDRSAALRSTSWGMFQILGSNFASAGFASVESFVAALVSSEEAQMQAFLRFIAADGILPYLQRKDWDGFALRYNGAGYKANDYVGKLTRAYAAALASPDAAAAAPTSQDPDSIVVEAVPPRGTVPAKRATASLNVRDAPGATSELVAGSPLSPGQSVTVLEDPRPDGWVHIAFSHGEMANTGWVNGTYLA